MTTYTLSDIYIGSFDKLLSFGEKVDIYSAREGTAGFSGVAILTPSLTPVLATADGTIFDIGFEKAGIGNYVTILHSGFLSQYGHLNDIQVVKGEKVVAGQLLGHSNGTGFAEQPQLRFRVALCDNNGNMLDPDNGFHGWTNPNAEPFIWDIKNLTAPVTPSTEVMEPVKVDPQELTHINSEKTSFEVITAFLIKKGLNEYLKDNDKTPIQLDIKPADPSNGEKIVFYLSSLFEELHGLKETLKERVQTVTSSLPSPLTEEQFNQLPDEEKDRILLSFFSKVMGGVKNQIFLKK